MRLPVLSTPHTSHLNHEAFTRAVKKARLDLFSTFADRSELDGAVTLINVTRPLVWDARCIFDFDPASASASPSDLIASALSGFTSLNLTCAQITCSAHSASPDVIAALAHHHYLPKEQLVMAMDVYVPPSTIRTDLQILPARSLLSDYAAFREATLLPTHSPDAARQVAQCFLDQLDDPRLDMLVARLHQQIVAAAGVFSAGEIGIVWDVHTHPGFRRAGLMRTLLHHLLELCQRSQYKAVILDTEPSNTPAITLYESLGFRPTGIFAEYWHESLLSR